MSRRLLTLLSLTLTLACAAPTAARQAPHVNAIHALQCEKAQGYVRAYFNHASAMIAAYPFVYLTVRPEPGAYHARPSLVRAMNMLTLADDGINRHLSQLPLVNHEVAVACDPKFRYLH